MLRDAAGIPGAELPDLVERLEGELAAVGHLTAEEIGREDPSAFPRRIGFPRRPRGMVGGVGAGLGFGDGLCFGLGRLAHGT